MGRRRRIVDRPGRRGRAYSVDFRPEGMPHGIDLVVEPGTRDAEPLLDLLPHEQNLMVISMLRDGEGYRAWGKCDTVDGQSMSMVIESDDGKTWRRPSLGLVEYDGSRANNFIPSISEMFPGRAISGATVFIDPSAPPEQRYKAIGPHYFTRAEVEDYLRDRADEVDEKALTNIALEHLGFGGDDVFGVLGQYSSDGLVFHRLPQPLVLAHTDNQITAGYDPVSGTYVAYFRDWLARTHPAYRPDTWMGEPGAYANAWFEVGHRILARTETDDFTRWPLAEPVLTDTPHLSPTESIYTTAWSPFPGAPDHPLVFPTVWDTSVDAHAVYLCSSPDGTGRTWQWLSREPLLTASRGREWDSGTVFSHPELCEFPDGEFGLLFSGFNVPHKHPRSQVTFANGLLRWPRGRLAGIRARTDGGFETVAFLPPGGRLRINALTSGTGGLEVEVRDFAGETVPGRSFADCDELAGDLYDHPVTWSGVDGMGVADGEPVRLAVRLRDSTLYWFAFGGHDG
ncbi:MAG: hypothetical protein QM747_19715 [Nocardioides sp.]